MLEKESGARSQVGNILFDVLGKPEPPNFSEFSKQQK